MTFAVVIQSLTRLARSLVFNLDPNNSDAVAVSWLTTIFVIAMILMVGMILYEWLLKRMDKRREPWGRNKILLLMLAGAALTSIFVASVYAYSEDFQTVVTLPGLFVGVFISWVMSVVIFLVGHFIIPNFRRDLYGF
jgi:MFS family permease